MLSPSARRRSGRPAVDIWPGFVDALAALLMVVIFLLVVFMVAQFYLSNLLTGQEELTTRLNNQVDELSDLLALEREENIDLRDRFAQLSLDLQGVVAERDTLSSSVMEAQNQAAGLEDQLAIALNQISALTGTGTDLDRQLGQAMATIRDNEATMGGQLRELASLRQDIEALRAVRQGLEVEIAALGLTLEASQAEAERLGVELDETISLRDLLRQDLESSQAENRSLSSDLASARGDIDALTSDLATSRNEIDWLTNELTSRQVDLSAAATEIDRLTGELTSRQADLSAAATEIDRLTGELESRNTDLESRNADLTLARTEIEVQAQEIAEQSARLQLSASEILELRDFLAERDQQIETLNSRAESLQNEIDDAGENLAQTVEERDALTVQLRLTEDERERLLAELGELRDRSQVLDTELADTRERTLLVQEELEESQIAVRELTADLSLATEGLVSERGLRQEAEQLATGLFLQISELNERLERVQAALEASEASVSERDIEIAGLNNRLNQALVRQVEELSRSQSAFFGRVREIIGDRPDIRIAGDRFVFQSGLLFDSGSANLREGNSGELAQIAATLIEVANELPDDIDWVLRVDGHTDDQAISNEEFSSNWELSTARATSVVRYLINQGLPPDRLAAAGFGEWQPLASNDTAEGRESNRRIELKIDQR